MDYNESNCPFCHPPRNIEIISENDLARAVFDIYPVSEGHCLIITKRHIESFFEATQEEVQALFSLVTEVKGVLDQRYNPDGFNIGININDAAGQTVPHVHVHLIPRYFGDVENPRGGVRNVIPGMGNY